MRPVTSGSERHASFTVEPVRVALASTGVGPPTFATGFPVLPARSISADMAALMRVPAPEVTYAVDAQPGGVSEQSLLAFVVLAAAAPTAPLTLAICGNPRAIGGALFREDSGSAAAWRGWRKIFDAGIAVGVGAAEADEAPAPAGPKAAGGADAGES